MPSKLYPINVLTKISFWMNIFKKVIFSQYMLCETILIKVHNYIIVIVVKKIMNNYQYHFYDIAFMQYSYRENHLSRHPSFFGGLVGSYDIFFIFVCNIHRNIREVDFYYSCIIRRGKWSQQQNNSRYSKHRFNLCFDNPKNETPVVTKNTNDRNM